MDRIWLSRSCSSLFERLHLRFEVVEFGQPGANLFLLICLISRVVSSVSLASSGVITSQAATISSTGRHKASARRNGSFI